MKKIWKKNKLLAILLIIIVITQLIGILIPIFIPNNTKEEITNNILIWQDNIKNQSNNIKNTIINNESFIITIWLIGISIIGVPIILLLYLSKLLVCVLELIFLIINIKKISPILIPFYIIPKIMILLVSFILIYHSLNFSLLLTKQLFLKRNIPIKDEAKKYLKVGFIITIIILLLSIIEEFFISKIGIYFL